MRPATPMRRTTPFERVSASLGFLILAAGFLALGRPWRVTVPVETPQAIPAHGWRHIAVRTWTEFNADQIPQAAGAVAFFALLAVFPAMAAFVSLYGLYADVGEVPRHLAMLGGILPRSALSFVSEEMTRIAGGKHAPLGLAFGISLTISLISANGAVKALFNGLNTAYEAKETRGIVKLNLISLAFTAGGLVFVLATLGLLVAAPVMLRGGGMERRDQSGGAVGAALAGTVHLLNGLPVAALPLWTVAQPRALALDHAGQRHGLGAVARRLHGLLLVRLELRTL